MEIMDVQILNNTGFVWNKEHVRALREKHRIIGSAIGFTPKTFNINLPFILMPVEIQLLKEKKIIKLYKVDCSEPPSQDKMSRAFDYQEQSYQTQIDEFKEERIARIHGMAEKIVEGKRKKMLQEARKKRKTDDDSDPIAEFEPEPVVDKELVINQEIASIKPITRDMQVIQTLTEEPWMDDEEKKNANWFYPYQDPLSRCRMFTFKDLWNNNYYISEGSKFGGDFLVYCGDPVKYHAKYIVICLKSSEEMRLVTESEGRVQDLVARCRLGTGVKKVILFSWLEGAEVRYKSLTRGQEEGNKELPS